MSGRCGEIRGDMGRCTWRHREDDERECLWHTLRKRHEKVVLVELERRSVAGLGGRGAATRDRHVRALHRSLGRLDVVALLDDQPHAARLQALTHGDRVRADHAARAAHRVVVARGPVVLVDGVGRNARGAEERHGHAGRKG